MPKSTEFVRLPISRLGTNPANPRKDVGDGEFDELVESIKRMGIIEPLVVRPRPADAGPETFEIVCGERRWKAAAKAGLDEVPVVIRDVTDEEALEMMFVENLMRKDLTDYEEAESFKKFVDSRKDKGEAILTLAEKTGIKPSYIRSRVAVMGLPKYCLDAWKKGDCDFGHMLQFLRVDKKDLKELYEQAVCPRWGDGMTPEDLADHIDHEAIELSHARFDRKACGPCPKNTAIQKELFGIGPEKSMCKDPSCFLAKQRAWFEVNWLKTDLAKKSKAPRCVFSEDKGDRGEYLYGGVMKACLTCPDFVTLINILGKEQASTYCVGPKGCYDKLRKQKTEGKSTSEKPKDGPKCSWHGEYFRDLFFREQLKDLLIKKQSVEGDQLYQAGLAAFIKLNCHAKGVVGANLGFKKETEYGYIDDEKVVKAILKAKPEELEDLWRQALLAALEEGDSRTERGFGLKSRRMVSEFLGIDLASEWAMNKEYLDKKTTSEILQLLKTLKIGDSPEMKKYLAKEYKFEPAQFAKLKKGQMVEAILKCGIDLTGRVPEELKS